MSFIVNFICKKPEKQQQQKKEQPYHVHLLFVKAESTQYGSSQNSTRYTKVMNMFHTSTQLHDVGI